MDSAELDRGRRLARRRMAWWSFLSLFLDMGLIFLAMFFGNPTGVATIFNAAAGIMGTIIAARVAIIMSYLGVSAFEATRNKP